jgi:hypothetical protein
MKIALAQDVVHPMSSFNPTISYNKIAESVQQIFRLTSIIYKKPRFDSTPVILNSGVKFIITCQTLYIFGRW